MKNTNNLNKEINNQDQTWQEWEAKQPEVEVKKIYYMHQNLKKMDELSIRNMALSMLEIEAGIKINNRYHHLLIHKDNLGSLNPCGQNDLSANFDKKDHENIDFIFCVKRDNPFNKEYEVGKTLDYYQQQKGTIEKIFIFR